MMDMPYAESIGPESTGKKCEVYRNMDAIKAGHLIDRDEKSITSMYQHFE